MEFKILGSLEVVDDGRPVAIRRGKEQALLAYLLLHANEIVPRGRLIDALWDEHPPPTAAKILQNAVSHLRKELGDARIVTRDPGYLFRLDDDELDVTRFERLAKEGRAREALALWRGAPLLDLGDERFADEARRRLDEQRLGLIEDRIDEDLDAGRHSELVPELEQLVAEDPLRERLQGQLMRALYGAGRQGDALETYRRARRELSEQLGLEPGPQLQELERMILNQDPQLAPTSPPARPRSRPRVGRANRRPAVLVVLGALLLAAAVFGIVRATGGTSDPLLATKNSLAVIDPQKNRVVKVIPIGSTPRGVTVGKQSVWTANTGEGTVSQIDPQKLRVVQTVGLGLAATALVETGGEVWVVTGSDNRIARIDARSGGVLGSARISREVTASAYAIAAGRSGIWVGSGSDIFRIDPSSHQPVNHSLGSDLRGVNGLAVDGNSVWIASSAETVVRVSATTLRPTGEASIGVTPLALAIAGDSIWAVANAPHAHRSAVWRIDKTTARVTQTTSLDTARGYPPTLEIAAGDGALWVASYDSGNVIRLDPATGEIVSSIHVGGRPSGIAVGMNRVWVTVS